MHKTDYQYRAIDNTGRLDFQDFVGTERAGEFAKKFGLLIAFGFLNNGDDDFVESVRNGSQKEISGFDAIDVSQVESLKKYFRLFFVRRVNNDVLQEGWLKQIHRSAGGGDKFLFNAKLFQPATYKDLMKFDWNKSIYRTEGIGKDNMFKVGLFSTKFDEFKKEFINTLHNGKPQNITDAGEQLYKLTYDTLAKMYQFN